MKDREKTIEWTMRYCQHYDPSGVMMVGGKEPHGKCKAGVVYLDQFGRAPKDDPGSHIEGIGYYESAGIFQRMCCTDGGKRSEEQQLAMCPKWLRSTREMGEARADDLDSSMERFRLVMPVVAKWRKKPPRGKTEVIECPACKGRLHLSQASSNGHVHGKCETSGCVSWME
jgi:hypothetical protein